MSSWAIVALVGILIWGVVQLARARAGITTDAAGNQTRGTSEAGSSRAELDAAQRELEALRERVKVLERIATEANTGEAREQARIAAEIEALRGLPAAKKEEPGQ